MNVIISEAKKKDQLEKGLMDVLSYFDAVNFAKLIDIPVFISCGDDDNITPYEGALKVFKNINNADKLFYVVPCIGHGCSSKSDFSNKIQKEFIQYYLDK